MYRKYSNVVYNGVTYYSEASRVKTKSYTVLAVYHPFIIRTKLLWHHYTWLQYFVQHSIVFNDANTTVYNHTLACVSWLKEHHDKDYLCQIWRKDLFDEHSFDFIPIQLLSCHCAHNSRVKLYFLCVRLSMYSVQFVSLVLRSSCLS